MKEGGGWGGADKQEVQEVDKHEEDPAGSKDSPAASKPHLKLSAFRRRTTSGDGFARWQPSA